MTDQAWHFWTHAIILVALLLVAWGVDRRLDALEYQVCVATQTPPVVCLP